MSDGDSRAAFQELLRLLDEVDRDFLSADVIGDSPADVAAGHRMLMHLVGAGLDLFFEADGARPEWRRAHWAGRKFYGDNADCIYHMVQIDPSCTYRIRGNIAGASYTSFTVDGGGIDERFPPARVVSSIHDGQLDVDSDGNYELIAGPDPQTGAWLPLEPDAGCIETRHYYETLEPIAADATARIPLSIELVGGTPKQEAINRSIARDIRRLSTFIRGLTQRRSPRAGATPNQFDPPAAWNSDKGYGAVDIVNMVTPYVLEPDQALVIEGRFPACRFASIALWNRYLQTLDYAHHRVSLNRAQTTFNVDGSFTIAVAERDPGMPNWIETTGVNTGTIYVRSILPEEPPTPLTTHLLWL
jgi:hypothetical protein